MVTIEIDRARLIPSSMWYRHRKADKRTTGNTRHSAFGFDTYRRITQVECHKPEESIWIASLMWLHQTLHGLPILLI